MVHFPNLEKNFIHFLLWYFFNHTWYDFPNLHILPLGIVILTPLSFFSICGELCDELLQKRMMHVVYEYIWFSWDGYVLCNK